MRVRWLTVIGLLSGLHASAVFACKYSVREVGFADIGSPAFRLFVFTSRETSEAQASTIRQICRAGLLETNVAGEVVDVDRQGDHAAMEQCQLWKPQSYPAVVLVSPDERSTMVPMASERLPLKESLGLALQTAVLSPKREEILREIIKSYAVVVLVEGRDAEGNRRAKEAADGAMDKVWRMASQMPGAGGERPGLVVISQEQAVRESILLWGLDTDRTQGHVPQLAVLYGRGRRMGPVLVGESITKEAVVGLLGVVGESCDCGLDRAWVLGTMIPLLWGEQQRSEAAELLGFDVDSPLVKTEISQILRTGSASAAAGRSENSLEGDGILGYSEHVMASVDDPPEVVPAPASATAPPQTQETALPAAVTPGERSLLRASFGVMGAMAFLVLAGGGVLILRARRRNL